MTSILKRLALGLAVLSMAATSVAAQQYRIQRGDVLRVEVIEDTSVNREVLVAPDGRVSIPLAGNVRVSGASIPEAQRRIAAELEDDFAISPTVVVSLVRLREPDPVTEQEEEPLGVFVIGEVNNPGQIPVEPGTTLLQALSVAGGVTDFAAVKRIQLRRQDGDRGERVFRFDYQKVLDGVSGVGLTEVHAGDVIVVPARRLFE